MYTYVYNMERVYVIGTVYADPVKKNIGTYSTDNLVEPMETVLSGIPACQKKHCLMVSPKPWKTLGKTLFVVSRTRPPKGPDRKQHWRVPGSQRQIIVKPKENALFRIVIQ